MYTLSHACVLYCVCICVCTCIHTTVYVYVCVHIYIHALAVRARGCVRVYASDRYTYARIHTHTGSLAMLASGCVRLRDSPAAPWAWGSTAAALTARCAQALPGGARRRPLQAKGRSTCTGIYISKGTEKYHYVSRTVNCSASSRCHPRLLRFASQTRLSDSVIS